MFARLAAIPRRFPFAFAVGYGGAKTIGADLFVQEYVERRETVDKYRAGVFLGFGLFQVGFVQYLVYCKMFPKLFSSAGTFSSKSLADKMKDPVGLRDVAKQVCLDMCVYHPFCYFPVFYSCKEIVGEPMRSPAVLLKAALQTYSENMTDDLKALWKIFIPVSIVQCSFVPLHLRVPFVATVGIFWCAVLSAMRGEECGVPAEVPAQSLRTVTEAVRTMEGAQLVEKM